MKVTVLFQNDGQGLQNLEAAYQTVARLLLKHLLKNKSEKISTKACQQTAVTGGRGGLVL